MADTPEEAIEKAAHAYMAGDAEGLFEQLAENVRVLGSEWEDHWDGRRTALDGLAGELARRAKGGTVSGSLVDPPFTVDSTENNMAWSSRKGRLNIDAKVYEASWTTILRREDAGWKIVHSHFSIHR